MGLEHPGRLKLYGRGVTKTVWKGKVGQVEPSLNANDDLMQKMDEMLHKKLDKHKATIRQDLLVDMIAKLQNFGKLIDPDILAALCVCSTGEASTSKDNNKGGPNEGVGKSDKSTT